jgi:hypothetical protein
MFDYIDKDRWKGVRARERLKESWNREECKLDKI